MPVAPCGGHLHLGNRGRSMDPDRRVPRARHKHNRVEHERAVDANSMAHLTTVLDAFESRVASIRSTVKQAHVELGRIRCDLEAMVPAAPATRRRGRNTLATLTRQERRIALLAASGLSNGEVAVVINIQAETVRGHMKGVFRKLAIHSRWELAYVLAPDGRSVTGGPASPGPPWNQFEALPDRGRPVSGFG